jgi:predicted acyl esterase
MSLKVGSIDVLQRPVKEPEISDSRYDGPESSLKILEKGFRKNPEAAAFQTATVFEKDVKIILRDGVKIRADIFRPHNDVEVPALIAWSPYGKTGRGMSLSSTCKDENADFLLRSLQP